MARFRVSDEVTYERIWYIEAKDEEAAIEYVSDHAPEPDEEGQIDNCPYEAEGVARMDWDAAMARRKAVQHR